MAATPQEFYDDLSSVYHLMFEDWTASIARQAAALAPLLERELGERENIRVYDCACGIGTQALGLAMQGFRVIGSDISPNAVARARREAEVRHLDIDFYTADLRDLSNVPAFDFDAVIAMDNALPHLAIRDELLEAARQIYSKLRSGGTAVLSIRDYDRLIVERPVLHGPAFHLDNGKRRIVMQIWDWIDERRYKFHLYITREAETGWVTYHGVSEYVCLLRQELTDVLQKAGFARIRWLQPEQSGFYQPVVLANRA